MVWLFLGIQCGKSVLEPGDIINTSIYQDIFCDDTVSWYWWLVSIHRDTCIMHFLIYEKRRLIFTKLWAISADDICMISFPQKIGSDVSFKLSPEKETIYMKCPIKVKKGCLWKQRTYKITKIGDSDWLSLFHMQHCSLRGCIRPLAPA